MDMKIEKNVPMPERSRNVMGLSALLKKMEIGDSIVIPKEKRNVAGSTARSAGVKIATRAEGSNSVRIWRTE
jgi:hypothetical protein